MRPPPSLFGPPPAVVGHRGAPRAHRENTPDSFAAAVAQGATWVEMDARLDAEGGVIVHHDPVLSDGRALITMSSEECAAAGVSSLEVVLAGLPAGLGVDLEIKNFPGEPDHDESMQIVHACAAVLARTGTSGAGGSAWTGSLMISSFNPLVLIAAADLALPGSLGLLTFGMALSGAVDTALDLGCGAVCPHHSTTGLDAAGIAAGHAGGLAVLVWTVDDPSQAMALADAGVDALCTNDPAGMVRALRRPGPHRV